jgi:cytidyltransferase-like protein
MERSRNIVMVSGCFDLLHAGHIAFFKTAAAYGDLHVFLGKDENILQLKGKAPYFSQEERKFMVGSVRYVKEAHIATGMGILDFAEDMERLRPDYFVVNTDGSTPEKKELCQRLGVEYIVLERIPEEGLPARSSSGTKRDLGFPYRICIAGGWMDQPWVSEVYPGSVVVAQILPTINFNDRSGMATSSRSIAIELWGNRLPDGDPLRNAQLLFGAENFQNTYVSGSQDHIGLLMPGINRLYYNGSYWPQKIESTVDPDICDWLSRVIHLVPLRPRPEGYNPLITKNLHPDIVKELGEAGDRCWESIIRKDVRGLGKSMTDTFLAWRKMLPYTVPDWVLQELETDFFPNYPGAITSGSGGGYVMVASEGEVPGSIGVTVRRS